MDRSDHLTTTGVLTTTAHVPDAGHTFFNANTGVATTGVTWSNNGGGDIGKSYVNAATIGK